MSSSSKVILVNEIGLAADINPGTAKTLGRGRDYVAYISVSNYVGGTFNGSIEHSPDGINWFTLATFAPLVANGSEIINITVPVLGHVRPVLTSGAGPNADVKIELNYDDHGR